MRKTSRVTDGIADLLRFAADIENIAGIGKLVHAIHAPVPTCGPHRAFRCTQLVTNLMQRDSEVSSTLRMAVVKCAHEAGGGAEHPSVTAGLVTIAAAVGVYVVRDRYRVVVDMLKRYDIHVYAYYTFAFYTGMRPEEMIALRYGDIDFNAGITKIQRVRTFKGSERDGTKTHTGR